MVSRSIKTWSGYLADPGLEVLVEGRPPVDFDDFRKVEVVAGEVLCEEHAREVGQFDRPEVALFGAEVVVAEELVVRVAHPGLLVQGLRRVFARFLEDVFVGFDDQPPHHFVFRGFGGQARVAFI